MIQSTRFVSVSRGLPLVSLLFVSLLFVLAVGLLHFQSQLIDYTSNALNSGDAANDRLALVLVLDRSSNRHVTASNGCGNVCPACAFLRQLAKDILY